MDGRHDTDHKDADANTAPVTVRSTVVVPLVLADGRTVESTIYSFDGLRDGKEHFAVRLGNASRPDPLVRLHSECVTGDVFGSARCDCGPQLQEALRRVHEEGGYVLYLRQEGRGIGLFAKLDAYRLQDEGHDTYAANALLGHGEDERDYGVAADMLRAIGAERIRLLSNNPDKHCQLSNEGIEIIAQVPTGVFAGKHNRRYLEAKVRRTGHRISLPAATEAGPKKSGA
ncbi:MAG: GTP cyclohydrolase II [Burkholderiales bacterium]|nr:GTP cyclohydrolase II [Burkholderiales bacterium]